MRQLRRVDSEHLIPILLCHIDALSSRFPVFLSLPVLRTVAALRHQQCLTLLVLARHLVQHTVGTLDHYGLVGGQRIHVVVVAAEQAFHHLGVNSILEISFVSIL